MNITPSRLSAELTSRNGQLEQELFDLIEQKIALQLGHLDQVAMINLSWVSAAQVEQRIAQEQPEFIVGMAFYNSLEPDIYRVIAESGRPFCIVGLCSAPGCYRVGFAAMANPRYFERYTVEQLAVRPDARTYICLNRKPRPHRRVLVSLLEQAGLADLGWISLGDPRNPRILPQTTTELTNDESYTNGAGIRNDIFSLGPLELWNRSLLCLVTESEFDNDIQELHYATEKTWKPLVGLRPFFIYGQPRMRAYLKAKGFDIFEDIFDYGTLHDRSTPDEYFQVARQAILSISDPAAHYGQLLPRLLANKETFYQYSADQYRRLQALDFRDYLDG
jgi:hypothetical protein